MAPITASITGFPPQVYDDERLNQLKESLCNIPEEAEDLLELLATCVEPWIIWLVEEQVDLHDWIYPLNLMGKAIRHAMITHPQLLLVQPVDRKRDTPKPKVMVAESVEDLQNIPDAPDFCAMRHQNLSMLR
eukprot:scaffold521_cov167-Amphora_coffeaeformis.AAC.43